jgi:co-chaperonin GroES (HSP10)
MKLNPVGYRVIVRPDTVKEMTDGGIVLATQTLERESKAMTTGTLIAKGPNVGHGVESIPEGARVSYAKYAGAEFGIPVKDSITHEKTMYRIINDEDILAGIELEEGDDGYSPVSMEDDD